MSIIALSNRQKRIAEIVRLEGPITGEHIAERLNVTRAALRMLMEEISNICVKDLQSVPIAIGQDKSAYEAIVTMFLEDVGSVFILDESGLLSGVVSRKDLLKAAINNADLHSLPVVMVMTPLSKIVVVNEDESVASAARKVIDNEIDSLPVVRAVNVGKRSYEVVGRITKTNFTRLLVDLAEGKGGHYNSES